MCLSKFVSLPNCLCWNYCCSSTHCTCICSTTENVNIQRINITKQVCLPCVFSIARKKRGLRSSWDFWSLKHENGIFDRKRHQFLWVWIEKKRRKKPSISYWNLAMMLNRIVQRVSLSVVHRNQNIHSTEFYGIWFSFYFYCNIILET